MRRGAAVEAEPDLDSTVNGILTPGLKRSHFKMVLWAAIFGLTACGSKSSEPSSRHPVLLQASEWLSLSMRDGAKGSTLFAQLAYGEGVDQLWVDPMALKVREGYKILYPTGNLPPEQLGVVTDPTLQVIGVPVDLTQLVLYGKPDFSVLVNIDPGVDPKSLSVLPVVTKGFPSPNPNCNFNLNLPILDFTNPDLNVGYAVTALTGNQLRVLGYTYR